MNILVDTHIFDDKQQGTRTYLKGLYSELFLIAEKWHFYLVAVFKRAVFRTFSDR